MNIPRFLFRVKDRQIEEEANKMVSSFGISDVEIRRDDNGAPSLSLSQRTLDRFDHPITSVSLSHDGDYAIAIAWVLGYEATP